MKKLGIFLLIMILAGCASSGGGGAGADEAATNRSQDSAWIHTELAGAYYERTQYAIALQEIAIALRADSDYAPRTR